MKTHAGVVGVTLRPAARRVSLVPGFGHLPTAPGRATPRRVLDVYGCPLEREGKPPVCLGGGGNGTGALRREHAAEPPPCAAMHTGTRCPGRVRHSASLLYRGNRDGGSQRQRAVTEPGHARHALRRVRRGLQRAGRRWRQRQRRVPALWRRDPGHKARVGPHRLRGACLPLHLARGPLGALRPQSEPPAPHGAWSFDGRQARRRTARGSVSRTARSPHGAADVL
jgi:hypothetical protein